MKYKIIVNPAAGRGSVKEKLHQLINILNEEKLNYDIVQTEKAGHGTELAAQAHREGYKGVIAVGGDGTVHEVLNGIIKADAEDMPLGIIPLGTGNDLARTLQVPFDLREAVRTIKGGCRTAIDIGEDCDGYFSIILGIGFPADVMHHTNTVQNAIKGPLAIFLSVYKVLSKLRPYKIKMKLDSATIEEEVMGIFILNTRFTGGGMQIVPTAAYNDGLLDIMVLKKMSRLDVILTIPKVYKGKHLNHPKVSFYRSQTIEIESTEPMRKTFDGNVYGLTPLRTKIMPRRLSVIVPEGSVS